MEKRLIDELKDLLGNGKLITEDIGADFCHDEYPGASFTPDAVAEVSSTEEAATVVGFCCRNRIPLTVRGAGTGQVGGSVPVKGGIVLSVKGMNAILGVNEAEKSVRIQPGVLLQDLKSEANTHGLYYPPDPGELTATVGGNAATNASGPCAVKYGTTHDYVLEATIVKADGSIETVRDAEKLSAVIGSEGTLAVITELKMKLIDKPKAQAILLFPFADVESCISGAVGIRNAGFDPAVMEFMDTDIVEFSGKVTGNPVFPVEMDGERTAATLMMVLEGEDDDDVMEKMETVAGLMEEGELECLDILVGDTPTMIKDMWAAHDAFHTSMEAGAKCASEINVTLPTDKLSEMMEFAKTLGEEQGLKVMLLSHVLSGGIHIHAVSDCAKDEFSTAWVGFADSIYTKVASLGGCIRGEYGIGCAKKKWLSETEGAKFKALKAEYDPEGILNPGKVVE